MQLSCEQLAFSHTAGDSFSQVPKAKVIANIFNELLLADIEGHA
jgi:hypothetical protein